MQNFKRLKVWQASHELTVMVVAALPEHMSRKIPGLRAQAVRAATSVAANIAEGCMRSTQPDFARFIEIALGSLNELEAHVLLARDVHALPSNAHARIEERAIVLRRMLLALRRSVQRRIAEDESVRLKSGPD